MGGEPETVGAHAGIHVNRGLEALAKAIYVDPDFAEVGETQVASLTTELTEAIDAHAISLDGIARAIMAVAQALTPNPEPAGRRLLRTEEVMALTQWSRVTLWRRVRDGQFPVPVGHGKTTRYFEDEVEKAIENLPRRLPTI